MEITVKGNVGSDPEIKFVKNNLPLVTFSVAYTPRTKQGEQWIDGETMWFRVTQFGEKAEHLMDSIKKGDQVLVKGSMKQSTYQAKDGSEKTSLEINATDIGIVPKPSKGVSRPAEVPSW
jgi:single-strand DNA-binding protein